MWRGGAPREQNSAVAMGTDADRLLSDYLAAGADADIEMLLTTILDVAKPIVRRIVSSALRGPAGIEDLEDVVSDTLAHLLHRLRDLKNDASSPIHDLRGYIATCAYNSCHERLRERFPARNRLRNHLHYLLDHHPHLMLWRSADNRLICGDRNAVGRDPAPASVAEAFSTPARMDPAAEDHVQIRRLVSEILAHAGAGVEFDTLVDVIACLIHLEQRRVELPLRTHELTSAATADSGLELRLTLRELWTDIRHLSARQRTALLLNLRDAHSGEILSLLPLTRTATIDEIAAALDMPVARLAELWKDLPLSDATIGALLGASPQQVLKLRRLARERLRRMAKRREKSAVAAHREGRVAGSTVR